MTARANRSPRRALAPWLFVGGLIAAGIAFGDWDAPRGGADDGPEVIRGAKPGPQNARVTVIAGHGSVIDGDTIVIGRRRIRIVGIDAPEKGQVCGGAGGYDCGAAATRALADLIAGRYVECRVAGIDRYRRALASCRADGRDLGAEMVRAGWAKAARGAPGGYAALEREARSARRGAWQGGFDDPARWRRAPPP